MKKVALIAAWMVMAAPHADAAERPRRAAKRADARVASEGSICGIRYDTGMNAGFHPDGQSGGNLNRVVGNRFNSRLGGPLLMTNMVTMITVFPANAGNQSVSIATAPTPMNTAMVLDFLNANLVANAFNEVNVSPAVTVGPDFLGLFIGAYGATQPAGLLGMSDMQTMGQAYHAVQGFYAGNALATMIQTVPVRNAMLRVDGDFCIPVELMDFKIE